MSLSNINMNKNSILKPLGTVFYYRLVTCKLLISNKISINKNTLVLSGCFVV